MNSRVTPAKMKLCKAEKKTFHNIIVVLNAFLNVSVIIMTSTFQTVVYIGIHLTALLKESCFETPVEKMNASTTTAKRGQTLLC